MNEIEELMGNLIQRLQMSKEYNQYKNLLERLKAQPDLYRRVGEFRKRSVAVQIEEENNAISANNRLRTEFLDLQNNVLANDFFVAERQYCRMVRELQERFLEGAQIETDFLED